MEQLIALILFLLAGYLLPKLKLAVSSNYKLLANVAFYVCLPASLLVSFQEGGIPSDIHITSAILLVSLVVSAVISYILARILKLENQAFYALLICGTFGNVVYLGFPFVESILGKDALPIAGVYAALYNCFVFLILLPLVILKTQPEKSPPGKGVSKLFSNPVIIATFLGAVSLVLRLDLSSITPYLNDFAALTTPLSLLAMGLFLARELRISVNRSLISITFLKCILFPAITVAILAFCGLWGSDSGKTMFLLSMMPVAVSNFVIVDSLGLEQDVLVMDAIVVTSILSVVLVLALSAIGIF